MRHELLFGRLHKIATRLTSWLERQAYREGSIERDTQVETYSSAESPESPVGRKEEDLLGRWRFAKNIYQIANSAPKNWSLRIGVFGDWGEGKTSVLKFIERMAKADDNIVAWFNPWEVQDRESLWADFATSVYAALEEAGVCLSTAFKQRVRAIARNLGGSFEEAAKVDPKIGALAGPFSSPLRKWLAVGEGELINIPQLIGNKRLIVMIDDLDRASPNIVPHMLLALRELLNLPSFIFILAFAPNIIAKALKESHPGWGSGFEFIDKIIDLQYRLPSISVEQLNLLAEHEINNHCDFVDRAAFDRVFDLVPRNPRKLKQFMRNLWCLKPEIQRHKKEELNWNAILLCQLLNIEYPALFDAIFKQKALLKEIVTHGFFDRIVESEEKAEEKFSNKLTKLFVGRNITDEDDSKRAKEIILAICDRTSILDESALLYQAQIGEQPHALTWQEFELFRNSWNKKKTPDPARKWLKAHAEEREENWNKLYKEVFRATVSHRLGLLEQAADSSSLEVLRSKAQEASDDLTLLRQLIFDLNGFAGSAPSLGVAEFKDLLGMVEKWSHFTNEEAYRRLRQEERMLLIDCVKSAPRLASPIMEFLQPWSDLSGGFPEDENRRRLRCELTTIAQEFVADDVVSRFNQAGGIGELWGKGRRFPEKYVLFRSGSPLWKDKRREAMLELASQASSESTIYENFIEFMSMLVYGAKEGGLGILLDEEVRELIKDKEVVGAAWSAVISRRMQPRMLGSFREKREFLKNVAGTDEHLPLPDWWNDMQKG
jgi:hypothetical protein